MVLAVTTLVIEYILFRIGSFFAPSFFTSILPRTYLLFTILFVAILRVSADAILKYFLTADLQVQEIASIGKRLFPIEQVLREVAQSVACSISIHSGAEQRQENVEDSLYLIQPIVNELHFMYVNEFDDRQG